MGLVSALRTLSLDWCVGPFFIEGAGGGLFGGRNLVDGRGVLTKNTLPWYLFVLFGTDWIGSGQEKYRKKMKAYMMEGGCFDAYFLL